ncbi:MAG: 2-octaprenyl-6-methoxyphenyl hydroxylase [Pseudomonadota bacterium]
MQEHYSKNQPTSAHIVIVGGGMVGISLALMLARQLPSVAISLIEQRLISLLEEPPHYQASFDERSTALSAGSQSIFHSLGCWSEIEPHVQAINTIHVSDKGHFAGLQLNALDYTLPALGYVIENRRLGQVLLQQLKETAVNFVNPGQVSQCQACKGGYQLLVRDHEQEQQLTADLVIIADGSESPLRQSLGIDITTRDYHQLAMIANVELSEAHRGVAYERFTDDGPIALLPLPDLRNAQQRTHRAALVWTFPSAKQSSIDTLDASALCLLLQQRFGYRAGSIKHIGQRHYYPLKLVQAEEQIRSHLAIVGNAAHFLHPVAGQGFNLALRDCQQLVQCVSKAPATRLGCYQHLKTYLDKQVFDQHATIAITDRLVTLFSSQRASFTITRQLGLLGLNTLPLFKTAFANRMMGIQ